MEPVLYICLVLGVWMLSLSARQACAEGEPRLRWGDVPVRVRLLLRRSAPAGFWVKRVGVGLQGGELAYWFTGSAPGGPEVAMLVLSSGEPAVLVAEGAPEPGETVCYSGWLQRGIACVPPHAALGSALDPHGLAAR